jgi:hypothetical protein
LVTSTVPHLVWKPKIPKGKVNDLNLYPHPNPNQSAQQVQHDQQGTSQQQPGLSQNLQQDVDNMEVDEADNEWPAWNPAAFATVNGQVLPQHFLDCELDGIAADITIDKAMFLKEFEAPKQAFTDSTGFEIVPWKLITAYSYCL